MTRNLNQSITAVFSLAIMLALLLPIAQRELHLFKRKGLFNVTVDRNRPELNLHSFMAGNFQKRFDTWFMQTSGVWGYLVTTHNQISYQFFKQIATHYGNNTNFMVGNDYHLFQTIYLRDYNGDTEFKKGAIKRLAKRVKILQDYMESRGNTLIVLISANKLILHPEILPEQFKKPEERRGPRLIDTFAPAADDIGLNWINTRELLEELKPTVNFRWFAKPAAHWNTPAACEVASLLMQKIAGRLREPINTITCLKDYEIAPKPKGADIDLSWVINVWDPSFSFEPTPYAKAKSVKPENARPLDLLYIGTSFLWSIFDFLEPIRTYPRRDFHYYASTNHYSRIPPEGRAERGKEPVRYKEIDWDKEVFDKDVIVLEVNEARLHQLGFAFLDQAVKQVKKRTKKRKSGLSNGNSQ